MLASASSHRERTKLVALVLFGIACGPPNATGDADAESGDESSSSASSSSETGTTTTSTAPPFANSATTDYPGTSDMPGPAECDSFAQDCPDGEKCVPYASTGGPFDANKCVPITGDHAPGEPCIYGGMVESTDNCDATSFCWDAQLVDVMEVGICRPFCTGSADSPMCPEGSQCLLANDGVIFLCIPNCDPILQDCDEGFACYWTNTNFNCTFTTQDIPPGDPCGFVNDCAEGNSCMSADVLPSCLGSACCSPFCQLGAGDLPCEVLPGTTCVPFFEQGMAPPGYEDVGVCLAPP